MKDFGYIFLTIILIFTIAIIIPNIINDAHVYDRVVMQMPDGTIVGAEKVRIRDKREDWRIICEDGSAYIIAKENCVIFD